MASPSTVITLGFGSFGSVNLLPTLGYGQAVVDEDEAAVCGVVTIAPRVGGTVTVYPRVGGEFGIAPRVGGMVTVEGC